MAKWNLRVLGNPTRRSENGSSCNYWTRRVSESARTPIHPHCLPSHVLEPPLSSSPLVGFRRSDAARQQTAVADGTCALQYRGRRRDISDAGNGWRGSQWIAAVGCLIATQYRWCFFAAWPTRLERICQPHQLPLKLSSSLSSDQRDLPGLSRVASTGQPL